MEATLQSPFGRTILGTATLTVGSTADNQLVLNDTSVTAQHAILRPEGQGYSLTDLGSAYGTFVNEQRLSPHLPRELQNGDTIRIGNIQLTYNVTTGSSIPPTVYAAPGQISDQGYSPTVLAPGGSSIPSTVYNPTPSPLVPPPAPSYNLSNPYETPASAPLGSSYVPPPPAKKRGHRGLWITLSIVGGILLIGIILLFILGSGPSMTPTQTYQSFCKDLKAHDAQAAYNLYSQGAKKQLPQADFTAGVAITTDCAVSNVDDATGKGTITKAIAGGGTLIQDDKVINEDNEWKIDAQATRETPTLTLFRYCAALKQGDYQTAYNQFNSDQQKLQTEAQFAASFDTTGKVTDCTISNIDDTAGKGTITYTYSSGPATFNETLVKENSIWKISNEQAPSTPTLTLNNYCTALKQGDYQTAYNQLNSDQRNAQTEAQFAANFNTNKVTNCSVSNVDDTAGTGTITYTLSNGASGPFDYTLVKEQDTWKIKTEKAKS